MVLLDHNDGSTIILNKVTAIAVWKQRTAWWSAHWSWYQKVVFWLSHHQHWYNCSRQHYLSTSTREIPEYVHSHACRLYTFRELGQCQDVQKRQKSTAIEYLKKYQNGKKTKPECYLCNKFWGGWWTRSIVAMEQWWWPMANSFTYTERVPSQNQMEQTIVSVTIRISIWRETLLRLRDDGGQFYFVNTNTEHQYIQTDCFLCLLLTFTFTQSQVVCLSLIRPREWPILGGVY